MSERRGLIDRVLDLPGDEEGDPRAATFVASGQGLIDALWEGEPRIAVGIPSDADDAIALNPQTIQPGEEAIVLARVRDLLVGTPRG